MIHTLAAGLIAFAALGAPLPSGPAQLPPGTAIEWIDDAVEGLRALSTMPPEDAAARVVDLYVGRQEYLELLYARGGLVTGDRHPRLDDQVRAAEVAFHELMAATRDESAADERAITEAVDRAIAHLLAVRASILDQELPVRPTLPEDLLTAADRQTPKAGAPDDDGAGTPEIRAILEAFARADSAYAGGRHTEALGLIQSAYLDRYEPLEARLPSDLVRRTERLVHLSLRPALQKAGTGADVHRIIGEARTLLLEADRALARPTSRMAGFGQGFVIILREGFEAVLLLSILLAGLDRLGAGRRLRTGLGVGAASAVVVSIMAWFVVDRFVAGFGMERELIEGGVTLLAAAVLVLVCNWLFRRTYVDEWKAYLERNLARASQTGSVVVVSGLAFTVVFREGLETVLFYQALVLNSAPGPVLLGLATGLVVVAALGVALLRVGRRLPVRQLFTWTNWALVGLAFILVGKGIYSLGEAGAFTLHPIPWLRQAVEFTGLTGLLGIHPTIQTLSGQGLLMTVLVVTFLLARRKGAMVTLGDAGAPSR